MSDRRSLFAANWKMNHLRKNAELYLDAVRNEVAEHGAPRGEVVVFPPFSLLFDLSRETAGLDFFSIGGQDLHPEASGAHTGDTSAEMLADAGARFALCGHSERRRDHEESDELIGNKVKAARRAGLTPVLCVGETLDQREAGDTRDVLARQLDAGLAFESSGPPAEPALVLAYEPVWAIGTGRTASPELAQEVHAFLRCELLRLVGASLAETTRVLYGGSVKPDNCEALFDCTDIDGFLIGGAGLDPNRFLDIIRRCEARS